MNENSAVIIGAELNGLGVVRSLARGSVPSIVLDTHRSRAAFWSRYARRKLIRSFSGADLVGPLIEIGKECEDRPVLFVTNELAVHTVSDHREQLSEYFRFRLAPDRMIKRLSNKSSFHEFAVENGLPVPRSVSMHSLLDLKKLAELRFPCALKVDNKMAATEFGSIRTIYAASQNEAADYAKPFLERSLGIVAQEWIEGPETNLYFTLFYRGSDDQTVSIFTGQKLLCSPRNVGNTALCRAAPQVRQELELKTLSFIEKSGYVGMGSMEFKWDDRYTTFLMVEPTVGRTDWQEEIATLSGVNLPLAAYCYELGLPTPEFAPSLAPIFWRSTFAQPISQDLRISDPRIVDGYFRWSDPLPALQYYCFYKSLPRLVQRWRRNQGVVKSETADRGNI